MTWLVLHTFRIWPSDQVDHRSKGRAQYLLAVVSRTRKGRERMTRDTSVFIMSQWQCSNLRPRPSSLSFHSKGANLYLTPPGRPHPHPPITLSIALLEGLYRNSSNGIITNRKMFWSCSPYIHWVSARTPPPSISDCGGVKWNRNTQPLSEALLGRFRMKHLWTGQCVCFPEHL